MIPIATVPDFFVVGCCEQNCDRQGLLGLGSKGGLRQNGLVHTAGGKALKI